MVTARLGIGSLGFGFETRDGAQASRPRSAGGSSTRSAIPIEARHRTRRWPCCQRPWMADTDEEARAPQHQRHGVSSRTRSATTTARSPAAGTSPGRQNILPRLPRPPAGADRGRPSPPTRCSRRCSRSRRGARPSAPRTRSGPTSRPTRTTTSTCSSSSPSVSDPVPRAHHGVRSSASAPTLLPEFKEQGTRPSTGPGARSRLAGIKHPVELVDPRHAVHQARQDRRRRAQGPPRPRPTTSSAPVRRQRPCGAWPTTFLWMFCAPPDRRCSTPADPRLRAPGAPCRSCCAGRPSAPTSAWSAGAGKEELEEWSSSATASR